MKNLSTGTGLCIAGLCAVAFPFAQKLASVESQAHAGGQASAMTAVASSATAQVTPTIVCCDMAAITPNVCGTRLSMRTPLLGPSEAIGTVRTRATCIAKVNFTPGIGGLR